MNDKHHIFLCGGTGEECGEGILLVRESLALYQKDESSQLYIVYETMDQGGAALGRIRMLTQNPFPIDSRDPHTEFGYVEVADKVRLKLSDMKKTGEVRLRDILPPEFQDRLLFNDWTLDIVLSKGFFGDMKAGALITDLALEAAEGSEADRKMGFEAVTDEVLNSNSRLFSQCTFSVKGERADYYQQQVQKIVEARLNIAVPAYADCIVRAIRDGVLSPDSDVLLAPVGKGSLAFYIPANGYEIRFPEPYCRG